MRARIDGRAATRSRSSAATSRCSASGRRATTDIRECEARGHVDRAPSYNTLFAAMQRPELTPILTAMVEASAAPLAAIERDFSVDATGFATSTYSRWYSEKYGRDQRKQRWLKAHAMVGNETNIISAIVVTDGHTNDAPELPGLVNKTAERFTIEAVEADKAYLSHLPRQPASHRARGRRPVYPVPRSTKPR